MWALAGRQPPAWPDAATAWHAEVLAQLPGVRALDHLDALLPLTADLSVGSVIVLVLLGVTTLATTLALDVPPVLGISAAVALMATRSAWSTVTPGHDALPLLVVSAGILTLALGRGYHVRVAGLLCALSLAAPTAAWHVLPSLAGLPASRRARLLIACACVGLATIATMLTLRAAWGDVSCSATSRWWGRLADVLNPSLFADISPWRALRQTAAVLVGDVHLFGLVVAVVGLVAGAACAPRFAHSSVLALGGTVAVVWTGLVPPAHAAGLLLPWWAACFALGLTTLVRASPARWHAMTLVFVVAASTCSPVLRHVMVLPEPWLRTMPETTRAVTASWKGGLVVAPDAASVRRLRRAAVATLPVDLVAIRACVAAGRRVYALGASIGQLEALGFHVEDVPLMAPMGAVLRDVRAGSLVALAATPGALVWAGPQGMSALLRLGVHAASMPVTAALGVVARTGEGHSRLAAARDGVQVSLEPGVEVGGRQVRSPLSVHAKDGEAGIDRGSRPLVTSATAAIAVFDALADVAFLATAEARPGLPMALATHLPWRHALVSGEPSCVEANQDWNGITRASRISVPLETASPTRPVIVYLATSERPAVEVSGFDGHTSAALLQDTFDRTADAPRLRDQVQADRVALGALGPGRFVVRLQLGRPDTWAAARASISSGTSATTWLVRVPTQRRTTAPSVICRFAAGGLRVLRGQSNVVDDASAREVTVWTRDGWHPAEKVQGAVFQWTGHSVATASFHADASHALVMALDATGADPGSGPQPVTIRVNGVVLHSSWRGAGRLDIPVALLRPGDNELTLEVQSVVRPPRDSRGLGVVVRALRVIEPASR